MSSPTRGVGLWLGVCITISLLACAAPDTPTPSPVPVVTATPGATLPTVTASPGFTPPAVTATPTGAGPTQSAQPFVTPGPPRATPIIASSPSPAPAGATPGSVGPMALVVAEQGFLTAAGEGNDTASYGLLLVNPNPKFAAHRVQLTVDFFDGAGEFLAGQEVSVTLLPTQTSAIAGNVFGAGAAVRMEVGVADDPTGFITPAPAGRFDITGSTSFENELVITTGELVSHFATDRSSVQVTVIYRNSAGAIVGGANGGVELIEAGERAPFDIVDGTSYPDISATEVYWQLSSALE